ncbi:protoporphyrinogen oxidase [Marmoricola endophyticus]|uniref:Coproporphyrinogen III oxidase n=1 Tax=Marmoricola endophyticus TaxID=2040280 RepID=A0A917BC44_9ACTN|nr:protoporphyrinogen oxidase [Marmoricola endophyticus]GGF36879.1 protoporphyrinogen oxidase [Marmoricola endophyticus]
MTAAPRPRVAVVGGGIAGAAVAHRVTAERPDADVVVLEAALRTGGKLATAEVAGVSTDTGAEAFLARRPEAVSLAQEVGLAEDVVHPEPVSARLWSRGTLAPLPRSLMGVPPDVEVLAGLLSEEGLARAREDATAPPVVLEGDVSVGDLVADRMGEEVVQRLVEPMLGGVYAGHAHRLSARAAVAGLVAKLDGTRTLGQAVAAAMPAPGAAPGPPVFAGLVGGVGRLPGAVLAASGARVRTGVTVRGLERRPAGWRLVAGPVPEPEVLDVDAVVLALPAAPAARLLDGPVPLAAAELTGIETASMAVVTLAFRADEVSDGVAAGSGFLVPPVEGRAVKGATFSFAKWAWVREAGAGVLVLRCSMGRHREEQVLQRTDEELVALARADLAAAVGLASQPVDSHVQRWGGGLPQYAVGHLDRVARIRRAVARVPALAVCGASYDGVGVPAVIGSAEAAAEAVLAALQARDTMAP